MKKYLGLILFLLQLNFLFSQIINHEDVVKVNFSLEQKECEAFVVAKITIIPGWHINSNKLPKDSYAIPSEININKTTKLTIKETIEPKPIQYIDEDLGDMQSYHKGSLTMKQRVLINSINNFKVSGVFSFQVCDEAGKCLMPHEYTFSLNAKGCEAIKNDSVVKIEKDTASQITKNKVVNNDNVDKNLKKAPGKPAKSMFLIFIISFLSGFAALLTPCVFPMIPMTVSFFTKKSKSKADGIKNALLYGISIIAIYVLLGTIVTTIFGPSALNALSTNVWFNLLFFVLLVVFAVSFLGAFEIMLPNSWLNKADKASDKGGFIGIFFMALALALVSFSCTGPIIGSLLVQAAVGGNVINPAIGMLGFSTALALPFGLFAAFPGWLNSLPKSGGWLNSVKVILGFLELALGLKFFSNVDLAYHWGIMTREVFIALWIVIFLLMGLYLLGKFKLSHDSDTKFVTVPRLLFSIVTFAFVVYLIPGMWGAPLKIISGFPPPTFYNEGWSLSTGGEMAAKEGKTVKGVDSEHCPHNLNCFHDYNLAFNYAKEIGKPLLVDFTGWSCVNCRKMEDKVWVDPEVLKRLRQDYVLVSLYVDDKKELPENEKGVSKTTGNKIKTIGNKWSDLQTERYQTNTQPFYVLLDNNEELLNKPKGYDPSIENFIKFLDEGLKEYSTRKK